MAKLYVLSVLKPKCCALVLNSRAMVGRGMLQVGLGVVSRVFLVIRYGMRVCTGVTGDTIQCRGGYNTKAPVLMMLMAIFHWGIIFLGVKFLGGQNFGGSTFWVKIFGG